MKESHELDAFLKDRDQILMAAWTLPTNGPLTDDLRRQALQNFDAYRRRQDLSFEDVARQVDSPRQSAIRELVKGEYKEHGRVVVGYRDNADEHVRTLNNWVEQNARQQAVKLKGKFVETAVARDIINAGKMVAENQTIGLVVGPAGIGKTRCAEALADIYKAAVFITVRWGAYHPKGLCSIIAENLGVRGVGSWKSDNMYRSQIERIVARLAGSNRLIIIDEAHKLSDDAIELVREIHDATQCPVLLLATKDLQDRIRKSADPDHGQLYSRVDITWPVTQGKDIHAGGKRLFSVAEIRALFEQTPIRLSPDATHYLQDIANTLGQGSLRRCRILLTNAARRARKRSGVEDGATVTVTADDLAHTDETLRPDASDKEEVKRRRQSAASAVA